MVSGVQESSLLHEPSRPLPPSIRLQIEEIYFEYLHAMEIGARTKPSQQQGRVPVKCIPMGARRLTWTLLSMGILLSGLFFCHAVLYYRTTEPSAHDDFESRAYGESSSETVLRYSQFNPAVVRERERVKFLLEASALGRLSITDRAFEGYMPKFVNLSKTWLGDYGDFNPRVMQDLVRTVKGSLDMSATNWSRVAGNPSNDMDGLSSEQKYRSCAVVGNSGILLSGSYGGQIDSHEMVIRLNNAEIYQYTKQVGSKTGISFMNSNILHSCSVKTGCWCHPYGEQVPIILYICQADHLLHVAKCMAHQRSALLLTHSFLDALCAAIVKWYSVTSFMQTTGRPMFEWDLAHHGDEFHYSSGMQAVVLALGICDSVDMFGFGKFANAKHHYHTGRKEELKLHDYAAEYLLYDDLVHNRTIPFLRDAGISIPPVRIFF